MSGVWYLSLFNSSAAYQHVKQYMGQQVDGNFVVVFDDETATGEYLAGQLMSHLKQTHTTCRKVIPQTILICL